MALRCPWCARRVDDSAGFCPACTAELLPASSWPVARMLVDAGVDRLALPERVRTLDDVTRLRLERAFEVQASVVRARLVEAAQLATQLRDPDLVDAVGDNLWPQLPLSPSALTYLGLPDARSFSSSAELAGLVARDDDVMALRQLAAIILLQRGERSREATDLVHSALSGDDAVAREAAMLLGAPSTNRRDDRSRDRVIAGLRRARAVAVFADDASVFLGLLDPVFATDHVAALAAIADDARAPLFRRVHAAIAVDDLDRLAELLVTIDDRDDVEFDDLADTSLRWFGRSERGDDVIAAAIARLSRHHRHTLLPIMRRPGPLVRRVFLDDLAAASPAIVVATVALFRRLAFEAIGADELLTLARAVDDTDLGVAPIFELLDWWNLTGAIDDARVHLVHALAVAVAADPDGALAHRLFDHVVADAVDVDDARSIAAVYRPLLDTAARTAKVVRGLVWRIAREPRCFILLTRLWPLSSSHAAAWAEAIGRSGSNEALIAWAWQRFVDVPDERAVLFVAFAAWRRELRALRDALPREQRPGGGTAVGHLNFWFDLDDDVLAVLDDAFALATDDDLVDIIRPVFLHAHRLLREGAFRLAVVIVFRLASRIEHASRRATDDDSTGFPAALVAAHDHLEERIDGFIADVRRRASDDVDGALHFLDDIAVERRLLNEYRERRRPPPPPVVVVVAREPAWTPPPPATVFLPVPAFSPSSVDLEPYDAGLGLPTVLSYAQVLIAMQQGLDTMGIFAAAGLDVPAWVAASQRWSQRFMQKPALAMRFGELLQLPWRSP